MNMLTVGKRGVVSGKDAIDALRVEDSGPGPTDSPKFISSKIIM